MSSHHVVRDAQEPALIIANGEACSWSLLQQAMDWGPMVMVLDGALDRVIELGIQYHVVLGDFDHQTIEDIRNKSNPDTQIIHTPDQNLSDLEKVTEHRVFWVLDVRTHQTICYYSYGNIYWICIPLTLCQRGDREL